LLEATISVRDSIVIENPEKERKRWKAKNYVLQISDRLKEGLGIKFIAC